MNNWVSDILGEGFEKQTLELSPDSEGEVVATLVRALETPLPFLRRIFGKPRQFENVDVLYVHGWSDYFFQTELAKFWVDRGARFYAVDLRKYGRSLREHQTPGYIEDLAAYDEEIELALTIMGHQRKIYGPEDKHGFNPVMPSASRSAVPTSGTNERKLVMLGHSTGGLTLSLWANRNPGRIDALILNSPWLEFQLSAAARVAFAPLIELSARIAANEAAPQIDFGYYSRAQRELASKEHPLSVNVEWRPERSMLIRPGWFKAITEGQRTLSHGLHIDAPVCVILSAKSTLPVRWDESLKFQDSVLNVEEVARAAIHLGPNLTIFRVSDALHDVFLSTPSAKIKAYQNMQNWLSGILASVTQ